MKAPNEFPTAQVGVSLGNEESHTAVLPEQVAVVPPFRPTQFQVTVPGPVAVSPLFVPASHAVPETAPQTPFTGSGVALTVAGSGVPTIAQLYSPAAAIIL